jgi:hypothetical protein
MKSFATSKWLCPLAAAALALHADAALACAACYGKSDSPLAQGMNWGIFSLLGVVVTVLGGIACCAVFLAKRAAAHAASASMALPAEAQGELVESPQKA